MQPQVAPQPTPDDVRQSNKKKLVWGLVCLLGPTALIVVSLLLYAIINFISGSAAPSTNECAVVDGISSGANCFPAQDDDVFGETGLARTITNIIMFLVAAVSVATLLPGIVVGIVLLATRKPVPPTQTR